jgi:hypothetical protein
MLCFDVLQEFVGNALFFKTNTDTSSTRSNLCSTVAVYFFSVNASFAKQCTTLVIASSSATTTFVIQAARMG